MSSVILVCRRFPDYDDTPGIRYHFPRSLYEDAVRAAFGRVVLIYEPRRGGRFRGSPTGGRMAFIGWAILGAVVADDASADHAYVPYVHYEEFPRLVSLVESGVSGKALESAVLPIRDETVDHVLALGIAPLLNASAAQEGLVDLSIPEEVLQRPIRQIVRNEVVRDRAFRHNVIDRAYGGRCALTGLQLRNGSGRAEVDAAHIRPVERGGPDVIQNGLAVSKTLHWAFDRGLISVADDGTILTVERGIPDRLLSLFPVDRKILMPARAEHRPHMTFLAWHRREVFAAHRE